MSMPELRLQPRTWDSDVGFSCGSQPNGCNVQTSEKSGTLNVQVSNLLFVQ